MAPWYMKYNMYLCNLIKKNKEVTKLQETDPPYANLIEDIELKK